MRDRVRFAKLMLALSLGLKMYGREFSTEFQEVYWTALADLSDDEFERAATVLLRREVDFPPPALFLSVARPKENQRVNALSVMSRAWWDCREYDPNSGTNWSGRKVLELYGPAAHEGFVACGASSGFRLMDDDFHGPRIKREFAEAYESAVFDDPTKALPGPTFPLLPTTTTTRGTA